MGQSIHFFHFFLSPYENMHLITPIKIIQSVAIYDLFGQVCVHYVVVKLASLQLFIGLVKIIEVQMKR